MLYALFTVAILLKHILLHYKTNYLHIIILLTSMFMASGTEQVHRQPRNFSAPSVSRYARGGAFVRVSLDVPRQAKIRCNEEKRQKEGREETIIIRLANRAREREREAPRTGANRRVNKHA